MTPWKKRGLALGCALTLVAGSALASSAITTRLLEAQFMGIRLVVSGQEVTPKDAAGNPVEPFAVDGTIYLPVRAVGDALGKHVEWDGDTNTVYVGKAPMAEDADQMVAFLESAHPAFVLDMVPEGYETAKADFLTVAADPSTDMVQFTLAAMAYAASLKDGHTSIDPFGNETQPILDVGWVADGDHLYLLDNNGAVSGTEVTTVGGMPVADLYAAIDRLIPAENVSAENRNHARWTRYPNILYVLGAAIQEDNSVAVTLSDGGKSSTRTFSSSYPSQSDSTDSEETIVSTRQMGDVFYVDMNSCVLGAENDAAAKALRDAVADGTTKVIIDVRGNGGGNSNACEQLLDAIGMTAPQYGVYVRYSDLALDIHQPFARGYTQAEGGDRYEPNLDAAKANPAVQLVVLTDEDTYSSATMMGVFVKDGGLGTIIGRASSNAPSSFGDILYYQLPHTSIQGTVSHKQWLRPDQSADPRVLQPDIETAVGEDALQTALDYLAKQ